LEWKNDGVMDDKSGDDDTGEVRWPWSRDRGEVLTVLAQRCHSRPHTATVAQYGVIKA